MEQEISLSAPGQVAPAGYETLEDKVKDIDYHQGMRSELMKDPSWGGLPPVGENPIPNRFRFMLELLGLMVLEIVLWGIYRHFTAPILGTAFSYTFFYFHIIAAPIIHLTPIFLYWRFRLKERGLPFLFTKKNLFTAVLVALIAVVILYILYQLIRIGLFVIFGIGTYLDMVVFAEWMTSEPAWFALMMFTFLFIVGPVEELQHRGFLQDQLNRVYKPWVGIGISAFFFGAGHLPIYFILYHLAPEIAVITMMYTMIFGLLMSLFYHWSRNIIGPIVLHGFWDWQLSVYYISFIFDYSLPINEVAISLVWWLSAALSMAIVAMFIYFAYLIFWKKERPNGSLGFKIPGIARVFRSESGIARTGWRLKRKYLFRLAKFHGSSDDSGIKTFLYTGFVIIIFCGAVMGVSAAAGWEITMHFIDFRDYVENEMAFDRELIELTYTDSDSGYTNENGVYNIEININKDELTFIGCTLTWVDEPSSYTRGTNEPDEFQVSLIAPNGETYDSGFSTSGEASVMQSLNYEEENFQDNYVGTWIIRVQAGNCGDDHSRFGIRSTPDNGNDWTLDYSYNYMGYEENPEM